MSANKAALQREMVGPLPDGLYGANFENVGLAGQPACLPGGLLDFPEMGNPA